MDLNKIYNEDCLTGLRKIKDKSIDLIVTDPPYGINLSLTKSSDKLIANDDGFSVMFFLDDILKEYRRVLKDGAAIYIFTRFDVMPYWWLKLKRYFDAKNTIVWDKGGGGVGDLSGNYIFDYEMILYATNGKHLLNGKREGSVWNIPKERSEFHPTQKPLSLIQKIIEKSSPENGIVLDPYMGSGTTAVACVNSNRNFIGFELEKEYIDIAEKRIEILSSQHKLF